MDKKYITTIVLEHEIDDEKKNTICADITKRLLPEGKLPIVIDSITVQEAPANMQPAHYRLMLQLAEQYKAQQEAAYQQPQEQYEEPPPEDQSPEDDEEEEKE